MQMAVEQNQSTALLEEPAAEGRQQEGPVAVNPRRGEAVVKEQTTGGGKSQNGRFGMIGAVSGLVLVCLLAAGVLPRMRRRSELNAEAKQAATSRTTVNVVKPKQAPATSDLILPGTTQAVQETIISARTNGFVRRWLVDIGDRVKAGQLLAEIETPEADQELRQGRQEVDQANQQLNQARQQVNQARAALAQQQAALRQARTNLELARVELNRSKSLVGQGVVAQEETDRLQATFDAREADVEAALANIRNAQASISANQANVESNQANVRAKQANVQRLAELQAFQNVTAPFNGIITARNIDVGSLINGGSSTGANGGGLFKIAKIDTIRTFVNVPQTFIQAMKTGQIAQVTVKELPQKSFTGRVVRTANALDPSSRTMPVEVHVTNSDSQLLPGMYAQVRFDVPQSNQPLLVPSNALVMRPDGTYVVVVRGDHAAHYQKVEVGRDYGTDIEVISGLAGEDSVVANPTDALREGTQVDEVSAKG